MDNLGNVLASLIVGLVVMFLFTGDDYLRQRATLIREAGNFCMNNSECVMTYEAWKEYHWAITWLKEHKE